jgi:hypothetical protein
MADGKSARCSRTPVSFAINLAAINNAGKFLNVQEEVGSFDAYIWRFVGGRPIVHRRTSLKDYPATTPESDALSKDLKQRGFKFVGSTICYAHMQATGMINHLYRCVYRKCLYESRRGCLGPKLLIASLTRKRHKWGYEFSYDTASDDSQLFSRLASHPSTLFRHTEKGAAIGLTVGSAHRGKLP